GVMNYLFAAPTIAFAAGDRVDLNQLEGRSYYPYPALFAKQYGEKIQEVLELYPWEIQLTQLNLLASHDTARLLSISGDDRASVEIATLLLLTYPGAPSIYYGDEVGLPGALDPDSRRSFPLNAHWELDVLDYHKQLIALRHKYAALRTGTYKILFAEGTVYVFARILEDEEIIVAVNVATQEVKVSFETPSLKSPHEKLLFGKGEFVWKGEGETRQLELSLPARSGLILGSAN
ncbi:MAG: alpha-amylase family glycosyl hydrolase, partial [Microcoleus sp.]